MRTDNMTLEQLCALFGYISKGRPLNSAEAAQILGVHPGTMNQYRFRGEGPRFFNPPGTRLIWYAERDVLAWLASGSKQSTSEEAAA